MKQLTIALTLFCFLGTAIAQEPSQCMKDYKTLRVVNGVKLGLTPVAGIGTLAGAGYLSFCYEYCVGWRAAINGVLGAAGNTVMNTVLPLGILVAFVGVKTFHTVRYVQSSRAHRLLKDAFGQGNGKRLKKVTKKIRKKCSDLSKENVASEIRKLDSSKKLCDGSLVRGLRRPRSERQKKKLRKRVAFEKDIIKEIVKSCD